MNESQAKNVVLSALGEAIANAVKNRDSEWCAELESAMEIMDNAWYVRDLDDTD